MKPETLIYEKVKNIIPENAEKTIFFAGISDTSYEVYFYTYILGMPVQCYNLAEQGKLDENELDKVFEAIVGIVKESTVFVADKYNVATIKVDKSGIKMNMDYYDKDGRIYKIKKKWEQDNIK
jgi:hypothetical protein